MSPSTRRVVCTGIGTLNPLGLNARESWSALLKSKCGITKLKEEDSFDGCQSCVAAYIDRDGYKSYLENPKQSYLVRNAKHLSKATMYAMLAAHEALEDAKMLDESSGQVREELRKRCGVAIGQGMVDFDDIYENGKLLDVRGSGGYRKMSPFFMTRALMNMSAGNVSIRYKLEGPNHCVSTACATGAHSIGDAFDFIRSNKADMMVCGSTEASINRLAIAGFERLKALCTKYKDSPHESSRPFDTNRSGFVMGEGAGIVILEELEHARARGLNEEQIYCELLGYGLAADAHHLTSPLPDGGGAKRCMAAALRDAKLSVDLVSHVNAHATSTPLGDDIECNAIEEVFFGSGSTRSRELTVTSCKGSIGHLLGAAGSVESVMAILSCKEALQPHCLNLARPLSTERNLLSFVTGEPMKWFSKERRILMKNSFGFGGTNASLILSNYLN